MKELLEALTLLEKRYVLYHGSESDDPRFKIGHTGKNSHTFGAYDSTRHGIFLTDNPKVAALYGTPKKYVVYPQKTANMEGDLTYNFMNDLEEVDRNMFIDVRQMVWSNDTWQFFEDEVGEEFIKWLKSHGYDSVTFEEYIPDDEGNDLKSNTFVLLDPSKIRHDSGDQSDIYDKIYESDDTETKLEESMWWLQRWVSGSARDPDWDESHLSVIKNMTDAFDYLSSEFSKSIPNKLYAGVSKKQIKNGHLLPHKKYTYKSFTTDKNVAKEFAEGYDEPSCVVSIVPTVDMNLIVINDFFKSKNPTIAKYMFALEDWLHQNEVLVKLNKPVKINNSPPRQQP